METELCLEVKLSLFVSAATDDSSPLTRQGVIELVQDVLVSRGINWETLIDSVRLEEAHDADFNHLEALPEGHGGNVLGAWR